MSQLLTSYNPHDGSVNGTVEISTKEDIVNAVQRAKDAGETWSKLSLKERITHMQNFREVLWEAKDDLSELSTKEMGMPISFSKTSTERGFSHIDWKLENVEKAYAPEKTFEDESTGEHNHVTYEPYGVCAAIAPWNFPVTNFVWATFNALLAGNTVVYKASEETPLFSKKLEDLVKKSTLPSGVLEIIYGTGAQAEQLLDENVNLISFTGSSKVGKILAKTAAEKFIPALLEMGGSDPAIVFEDADIDMAVEQIVPARFNNTGQICCSLKRLIVHKSIYEDVVAKLKEKIENINVGNPMNESTTMGPLCAKRFQTIVEDQVKRTEEAGATILCGGSVIEGEGAYYKPTLITNVKTNMSVWREEVFGPVLPVIPFETYEEAIELANDTEYGLGSNVFTQSKETANKAVRDIKAGMVRVNATNYNKPCNPFGGYKQSGLGRTNGMEGFYEVVQIKTIASNL